MTDDETPHSEDQPTCPCLTWAGLDDRVNGHHPKCDGHGNNKLFAAHFAKLPARPVSQGTEDRPEQAAVSAITDELQLAQDGDGYEPRPVAEEIVQRHVSPLVEQLRQARAEIERLTDKAATALADQAMLKGLTVEEGAAVLELAPPRELVIAWVDAARKMLGEAENYSETRIDFPAVSMEVKAAGEFERYAFTVQRVGRLTPHEARKQVETERDRLRLAWQSAARGRMRARIERDTLGECMPCTLCDDTGIAPENRFGRDSDGAPMADGDQPCPKGCPVRRDIAYLRDAVAEYDRHAPACLRERDQLRADLETRTRERDEARADGRLVQGEADRLSEEYARADGETTLALRRLGETEAQRDGAVARWIRDSRNVRERLDFLEARLASAVVLPEHWYGNLWNAIVPTISDLDELNAAFEVVKAHVESWRAAPVGANSKDLQVAPSLGATESPVAHFERVTGTPFFAAPVEAETPAPKPDDCGACYLCLEPTFPELANSGIRYQPYLIVCSECGNKRCPHATDHHNACTGSNEPGQPGSRYASPGTGTEAGE